jgi:hypothetical protein
MKPRPKPRKEFPKAIFMEKWNTPLCQLAPDALLSHHKNIERRNSLSSQEQVPQHPKRVSGMVVSSSFDSERHSVEINKNVHEEKTDR